MTKGPPMSEALRQQPLNDGLVNGAAVSDSKPPATGIDSRLSRLYRGEQHSLSIGQAFALLVKSWPFIRPHRRLLTIKFALALTSLTFFLLTPWPMKIVVDNVIN